MPDALSGLRVSLGGYSTKEAKATACLQSIKLPDMPFHIRGYVVEFAC